MTADPTPGADREHDWDFHASCCHANPEGPMSTAKVYGTTRPDMPLEQEAALALVLDERKRQDAKWGEQNHGDLVWSAVLVEEVGEASQAILKARGEGGDAQAILDEAVQCAAVAVAWVEALLRNGPTPGRAG